MSEKKESPATESTSDSLVSSALRFIFKIVTLGLFSKKK
jgi:hypothetical protein